MNKSKIRVLPLSFAILTLCGCWRPKSWTSIYKKILYNTYTMFIACLLLSLTFCQLMDMVLYVNNTEDFVDNFYLLLAMAMSCCKLITLLANEDRIFALLKTLTQAPLRATGEQENQIQKKFLETIRTRTICYAFVVEATCACMTLASYITHFKKNELGFRTWIPFDYYVTRGVFALAFGYQWLSWITAASLNVACDTIICGFLVEICCQFEILELRLKKFVDSQDFKLGACVYHHDRIYQFAYMINETFKTTIFVQFFVSTLVVCFILSQLVKNTAIDANLLQLLFYMTAMLTQIFFYCWCGNEVKLKSVHLSTAAYKLDWTPLGESFKRIFIMIMRRSSVPIEFTCAIIITLNLGSFVSLLKTSYSAYNVLQQAGQG